MKSRRPTIGRHPVLSAKWQLSMPCVIIVAIGIRPIKEARLFVNIRPRRGDDENGNRHGAAAASCSSPGGQIHIVKNTPPAEVLPAASSVGPEVPRGPYRLELTQRAGELISLWSHHEENKKSCRARFSGMRPSLGRANARFAVHPSAKQRKCGVTRHPMLQMPAGGQHFFRIDETAGGGGYQAAIGKRSGPESALSRVVRITALFSADHRTPHRQGETINATA